MNPRWRAIHLFSAECLYNGAGRPIGMMEATMTTDQHSHLRRLEGHHIRLALVDGSTIDDCELVSAGRRTATIWVLHEGADAFLPVTAIQAWAPVA